MNVIYSFLASDEQEHPTSSALACEFQSSSFAVVQLESGFVLPQHFLVDPPQQSVLIYPAQSICRFAWGAAP